MYVLTQVYLNCQNFQSCRYLTSAPRERHSVVEPEAAEAYTAKILI